MILNSANQSHLKELSTFKSTEKYHSPKAGIPSILKWTGSKRSQAEMIVAYVPAHAQYFEPFLGSGALLYLLGKSGAVCGDIYAPLISFWSLVRDKPEHLISDYEEQWNALQADLPNYYYIVRNRFNEQKRPEDLNFLMRTCVNGIVRFNKVGEFNNSFHCSRKGMLPKNFAKIVRKWYPRLKGVEFRTGDFEENIIDAGPGDFIYLDPPYAGNRQRYIRNINLDRLYRVLEDLNYRGVKWALSFDGLRGKTAYDHAIPNDLYKRKMLLKSGYSAISKVLNGPIELVKESLYLNY